MVSLRVCKLGKTSIHIFVPDAKVNSAYYCNKVFSHLLSEMEHSYQMVTYIFQQDKACPRISKLRLAYLKEYCC